MTTEPVGKVTNLTPTTLTKTSDDKKPVGSLEENPSNSCGVCNCCDCHLPNPCLGAATTCESDSGSYAYNSAHAT